jgi:tetratricopeptide (TPR) repeat protein
LSSRLRSPAGDPAGARKSYRKAIDIRRKLAEADPGVGPNRIELASSLNNFGNLLSSTGDPAGARAACEEALAICQKLADSSPRGRLSPARHPIIE